MSHNILIYEFLKIVFHQFCLFFFTIYDIWENYINSLIVCIHYIHTKMSTKNVLIAIYGVLAFTIISYFKIPGKLYFLSKMKIKIHVRILFQWLKLLLYMQIHTKGFEKYEHFLYTNIKQYKINIGAIREITKFLHISHCGFSSYWQ